MFACVTNVCVLCQGINGENTSLWLRSSHHVFNLKQVKAVLLRPLEELYSTAAQSVHVLIIPSALFYISAFLHFLAVKLFHYTIFKCFSKMLNLGMLVTINDDFCYCS